MTDKNEDLYHVEKQTIDRVELFLDQHEGLDKAERGQLKGLLKEYRHLLRQVQRLVKMADRNEEIIRAANVKITAQQVELADANSKLSNQNEVLEVRVADRTKDLLETQEKIETLIELGIALSAERDHSKLLETILIEAKNLANADGGTLYLVNDDHELEFTIVRTDSLNIALGGTAGGEIPFPKLQIYLPDGTPNTKNVATNAALLGETINIEDAYDNDTYDFTGTQKFDEAFKYRSTSFLTIPMKARDGEVIGVLQLINATNRITGEVRPFDDEDVPFVESLSSQAAVALENQNLIEDQRKLTDAFIELIAGAIDAKSPYTGGHCQRVPVLSMMMADAASAETEGIFEDYHLNDDERYEFHIGCWLHDCGKVTTPEHVVDKATKLETISNRIHEVRMRFEVLRRDAEIKYWKQRAEGGDIAALDAELTETLAKIEDDFTFLAECNVGGEFMSDDKQDRVRQIATTQWTRHYDDRIGLAHEELERKERAPAPDLPVIENLLADKIEHVFYRDDAENPFGENELGFNMKVPQHLYDNGEVYNLCIARGTLNEEERFKINDHIIQTITMLSQLPFTKDLRRVPEIAAGHHEMMNGKGYPRGLKRNEMSVSARIVGVADIFEALTASDRPYKKAKTLSAALKIMGFMRKDEHIDPDLFELFLRSGIYLEYAERFLDPAQIDEVNIEDYLPPV